MRVFIFKPEFVPGIEQGTKRGTIRNDATCKPGEPLSLRQWSGRPYWSKQKEIKQVVCENVEPVVVDGMGVLVAGRALSPKEATELAASDGFESTEAMIQFFRENYKIPYCGKLVTWREKEEG